MLLTRSTRAGVLEEKGGHAVERRRGEGGGRPAPSNPQLLCEAGTQTVLGGREILIRSQCREGEIRKCIWGLRENSNRVPWRS